MIGLDTNILVRLYLADDVKQYEKAKVLLSSTDKSFFISSYVLLELVWVLKTRKYTRAEIYDAVSVLIDSNNISIGRKEIVIRSLDRYLNGKADFGDYMILEEGKTYNSIKFETFDKMILKELG
jgi:predicted nucleic-acid-binding protein